MSLPRFFGASVVLIALSISGFTHAETGSDNVGILSYRSNQHCSRRAVRRRWRLNRRSACCTDQNSHSARENWISMFNGTDLTGWKANTENPDSFKVVDGVLVIDGPRCHLFWVGDPDDPTDEQFTNFHWHAKVKTLPQANSGLYFHTKYQDAGWPAAGYECQVNQTHKDRKKTGGLYAVADVLDESPVKDGEWYDYDIIVDGPRIVLKINGEVTTDWEEPTVWITPKGMEGRKLSSGTFAIQAHDPKSVVHYKDLRVKRLP